MVSPFRPLQCSGLSECLCTLLNSVTITILYIELTWYALLRGVLIADTFLAAYNTSQLQT